MAGRISALRTSLGMSLSAHCLAGEMRRRVLVEHLGRKGIELDVRKLLAAILRDDHDCLGALVGGRMRASVGDHYYRTGRLRPAGRIWKWGAAGRSERAGDYTVGIWKRDYLAKCCQAAISKSPLRDLM